MAYLNTPSNTNDLTVTFILNNKCNLDCKYCYVKQGGEQMTISTAKKKRKPKKNEKE